MNILGSEAPLGKRNDESDKSACTWMNYFSLVDELLAYFFN